MYFIMGGSIEYLGESFCYFMNWIANLEDTPMVFDTIL